MRETVIKEDFAIVDTILRKNDFRVAKLIPILQAIQEEFGYLSRDVMGYVATALKVAPAKVFGVATFYAHFALEPKGKHVIRLCNGTACHVKRADGILEALTRHLKLPEEGGTTADRMITIETVSCLGACGLAPVMLVNDDVHGQVTPQRALELVNGILKQEEAASGQPVPVQLSEQALDTRGE